MALLDGFKNATDISQEEIFLMATNRLTIEIRLKSNGHERYLSEDAFCFYKGKLVSLTLYGRGSDDKNYSLDKLLIKKV